ncbi:MAG: NAD(P)-dependent oxidoreductase [Mucilaginibacter sp.]|uniref:NAD-dependent epimerase/dehydratase family protein n=1 Tax=Mucilaginibacter sp. TaxID=1882438 RepID=UPI00326569D8
MHISIIGTNGLLSACIGSYCNEHGLELHMYGKTEPKHHTYTKFIKIDLLNENLHYEELSKSDVIIYTAGAGIQFHLKESPDAVYNLNVSIPVSICNNLIRTGYKGAFISFGSYFEIGETAEESAFTEVDVLRSQLVAPNDYSISKRMLSRFFNSFRAPFTFLHFILPTIYGEHESAYRLIPYTLRAINENTNLTLTSGVQVRQYIYIQDVVNVLFNSIASNLVSGIYNISGVEEFSVKELVTVLFDLNDKEIPDNIFGKTDRVDVGMKVLRLNGDKLKNSIGYTPSTKIAQVYNKYICNGS